MSLTFTLDALYMNVMKHAHENVKEISQCIIAVDRLWLRGAKATPIRWSIVT